jgi:hypothetical protein
MLISVAEHFTPAFFLKQFRDIVGDFNVKPTKLGVHYNTSAYAPYPVFSQFLYNFALWGVFWDTHSGDMDCSLNNLEWYIYIELSCAPSKDPFYGNVSTPLQIINSLPVLHLVGNLNVNYTLDLEIDDDVQLICGFVNAYNNDILAQNGHEFILSIELPSIEETKKILDSLFGLILPHQKNINIPASQVQTRVTGNSFLPYRCIAGCM